MESIIENKNEEFELYERNKILEEIDNCRASFIIKDPDRKILDASKYVLEKKGYKIKIIDPRSNSTDLYNPLKYVKTAEDIIAMSKILTDNYVLGLDTPSDMSFPTRGRIVMQVLLKKASELYKLDRLSFEFLKNTFNDALATYYKTGVFEFAFKGKGTPIIDREKLKSLSSVDGANGLLEYVSEILSLLSEDNDLFSYVGKVLNFSSGENAKKIFSGDTVQLDTIGRRKTAIFIVYEKTKDRCSFVANIMYLQAIHMFQEKAIAYENKLPIKLLVNSEDLNNFGMLTRSMTNFVYEI